MSEEQAYDHALSVYVDGEIAYAHGTARTANPHMEGTALHDLWDAGWVALWHSACIVQANTEIQEYRRQTQDARTQAWKEALEADLQGYAAGENYLGAHTCPYESTHALCTFWANGYQRAKFEAQMRTCQQKMIEYKDHATDAEQQLIGYKQVHQASFGLHRQTVTESNRSKLYKDLDKGFKAVAAYQDRRTGKKKSL